MAAVAVGTGIRPEETTCCGGRALAPCRADGELVLGRHDAVDRWTCWCCGSYLRAALSGFVPRGLLIVTEVVVATFDSCWHSD